MERKDGEFIREETYCDGYTQTAVLTGSYCLVPMTVLRGSDYNLELDDTVRAKVRAHNQYGYGDLSPVTVSGLAIQTEPA